MNRVITLFLLLPLFSLAQKDGMCVLKGHIDGLGNKELAFHYWNYADTICLEKSKSVKAHHDDFIYKTLLTVPTYYQVRCQEKTKDGKYHYYYADFFLEKGNLIMKGQLDSFNKAVINGSPVNDEWKYATNIIQSKFDSVNRLDQSAKDLNSVYKFISEYVYSHPHSYISAQLLSTYYDRDLHPDEARRLYMSLDNSIKNTSGGIEFKRELDKALKIDIGLPAPDVTLPDMDGKNISLSSFKGKVTLLDFWASWCWPCRGENPNLVKAYRKYHDKGFEIYGVSLDANKTAWKNAISKDSLTWTQVSDLKGRKSDAVQLYGINGIPSNVLIDPNGLIIAKDLSGDDLEKKLSEILK